MGALVVQGSPRSRALPYRPRRCSFLQRAFVVAQEELHPDARETFWDLRSRRSDGSFAPLDFTRRMITHLNTGYLSEQLAGFPDQEMV